MARIAGELVINRPVDEVFDFVADERNEPRYNPRIRRAEKLSPGPIGRGTRFRAEAVTLGRTVGMTSEYTVYERPKRLGSSVHMAAADILGTLGFDPVPDGTRMSWSWEMRLRGLYRLLTPHRRRRGPAPGAGQLGRSQAVPGRAGHPGWRPGDRARPSAGSGDEVGPVGDPDALRAGVDEERGVLEPAALEGGELSQGDGIVRDRS